MVYTGRCVRRGAHLRPSLAYLSAILVERLRFRSSASVLTAQSGVLPNRRCSDMPTRRWPEVFTGSESYLHASSRLVQCKSVRARCGPCGELVHTPCVAHSKMVHMVHIRFILYKRRFRLHAKTRSEKPVRAEKHRACFPFTRNRNDFEKHRVSLDPCRFSLTREKREHKKQDGVFKDALVTKDIYLLHHDAQDLHAPKYGSETTQPQIVGS